MSEDEKKENESEDSIHYESETFELKSGECAILVTDNSVRFIYNEIDEELNEIQTAAAGAVAALSIPEWRKKLIELLIDNSDGALVRTDFFEEGSAATIIGTQSTSVNKNKKWNIN